MLRGSTVLILFYLIGLTQACFASVSLSVNTVNGSNSLRFDSTASAAMENKQEIHIRINSTNGDRYQVYERVLEPMTNEKGEALNLQAIEAQTLSNSNSYGTLFLQNSDQLTMGEQLLYTSSQSGQSDAFIVGYSLNQALISNGGSFRGRFVFEVRDMSNASSAQATIDVFLDTTLAASGFKIFITGGHAPGQINVKGSDITERAADYVKVFFTGNNSGQQIKIYQEVEATPQNETEEELGEGVLQLDAEGNSEALRTGGLISLGNTKTLVYSSNKESDNFVIYFLVDPKEVQQQDAGNYRGRLKYIVETGQGSREFLVDLNCNVPPVFSINVTPPVGGVAFTHVLASNPPQDIAVLVTVLSNLHKPYQVLQNLQSNMTNQQGKEFDSKYFTIQVQIPSGQKGQTDFTEFSPMQTGDYPVYTSDARGSGASFEVVYRLQGYAQMSPGDFLAPVRFSLDQK